ncbi:hypothetical protein OKJ48_36645 [Streptomyces kunmingensis]|uniref:Uncharacterized protein n=1 Tax=Streptomyces kunmingensis TaxID=68225 RepID=A0ABU6CLV3_9ACTN|nr:hypothetical protein [Streptomyces kunmingensis]MEB3965713.1 hypothetical protein [Streptomyces kunmingensis]
MTDHRLGGPAEDEAPIPRDLPDQQADAENEADEAAEQVDRADDVPETDEAGTRRRGDHGSDTVHPEHPDPDESPA